MKLFLDSANLQDVELCLKRGVISGITTNPSLMAKEPKSDFILHIKKIAALCMEMGQPVPLSVEVFTRHPREMVPQALELVEKIGYENVYIKVPIGWDELEAISALTRQGVRVNCTCMFTEAQAILAANAGAQFLSIFMARLRDIGADPVPVISNVRQALDQAGCDAEIIVGSIRHERDIVDAHLAGGHIVTAGAKLFEKMALHPQTTKSVEGFLKDFEAWLT